MNRKDGFNLFCDVEEDFATRSSKGCLRAGKRRDTETRVLKQMKPPPSSKMVKVLLITGYTRVCVMVFSDHQKSGFIWFHHPIVVTQKGYVAFFFLSECYEVESCGVWTCFCDGGWVHLLVKT